MTASPSQVPLYNRYEVLEVEPNNDEGDGPSSLEVLPRLSWPVPCIRPLPLRKNGVIFIGDSLMSGAERPIF